VLHFRQIARRLVSEDVSVQSLPIKLPVSQL